MNRSCRQRVEMEAENGTFSNLSATEFLSSSEAALTAFLIVALLTIVAVIIFTSLIAMMLLLSPSVAAPVRVTLMNLLVSTLIASTISLCSILYSVTLALGGTTERSLPFCRFSIWLYDVALEARLLGLVTFSVMVLQTVTCSMRKIRFRWLSCSLVATWVVALLVSIDTIIPPIYGVQYVDDVACFPAEGYPEYEAIKLTYSIIWLALACILPLLVCICIPLVTLCYIKRHTITEGAQYKKALAKFATFLITSSTLIAVSQLVPAVVAISLSTIAGVYLVYITTILSFIPTPILIVVFLKPVRKRLHRLLCRKCWKSNEPSLSSK